MNDIPQVQGRPERISRSPSTTRRVAASISAIVRSAVASSSTPGRVGDDDPPPRRRLDVDVVVADGDVGDAAQPRPRGLEQLLVDPVVQQGQDRVGPGHELEQVLPRDRLGALVDPHLTRFPERLERRLWQAVRHREGRLARGGTLRRYRAAAAGRNKELPRRPDM